MISQQRLFLVCLLGGLALTTEAFAPVAMQRSYTITSASASSSALHASSPWMNSVLETMPDASSTTSSTHLVAAATLDPTTFLSDLLGGFINSNLILAVPIVAALGLASLVAFLIVAYANPAEAEDDEY